MDWNKTSYFIVIASILPFKKDCVTFLFYNSKLPKRYYVIAQSIFYLYILYKKWSTIYGIHICNTLYQNCAKI